MTHEEILLDDCEGSECDAPCIRIGGYEWLLPVDYMTRAERREAIKAAEKVIRGMKA